MARSGKRLDQQRQAELEPKRMASTMRKLERLGFTVEQYGETKLLFYFKGSPVHFYPYSGWFSGKTVKDGRGFGKLIKQIS